MKKWVALVLCCALLSGCVGCSGEDEKTSGAAASFYFDLNALDAAAKAEAAQRETAYLSHFGSFVGERVTGNLKNWLYNAYESNPLMLDSVRQNGKTDIAEQVDFWFGMFAPCLLRSAAGCYDMEKDAVLYEKMEQLVSDSIACIEAYGTLEYDLNGEEFPLINPSWLNGVMAWYNAAKSENALRLATLIGDYYIEQAELRGINDSMPIGGVANLCLATQEPRFYELLQKYLLATGWTGGDYLNAANSGTEFCQMARHNWENVFEVEALGVIGDVMDDPAYTNALRFMFESIVLTDRRSTGANTTMEGAIASPYKEGSAETCGNVTWLSAMAEASRRLKQSDIADELELTFWNATLGAQDAAGRWWTYDTPAEGHKLASINHLNWQAAQGAPEFSCCMSNCSLGIGTLPGWALLRDGNGIYINYYGESEFVTATPAGNLIQIQQQTQYPADGSVRLVIGTQSAEEFTMNLRIPVWSASSTVKVNGKQLEAPKSGGYYSITKTWANGDVIELSLDMSLHYWAAEDTYAGYLSAYYGPVLLTVDQRFNPAWSGERRQLDLYSVTAQPVAVTSYPAPAVAVRVTDAAGEDLILCDLATAGQSGTYYTSWFFNNQLAPQPLQRNACSWNQRISNE